MYLISRLYLFLLKKKIENNNLIKEELFKAEINTEIAKKNIEKKLNSDKEKITKAIPARVRKYLGFDY